VVGDSPASQSSAAAVLDGPARRSANSEGHSNTIGFVEISTFQLGKDKAQYLAACFLILPV